MRTWLAFALAFSAACRYPNADQRFFSDFDEDGFVEPLDCNDEDAGVNPDADESCNEVDDDCDETVDEDAIDPSSFWVDADSDGFGDDDLPTVQGCAPPTGYAAVGGDCNDDDKDINPGVIDIADDDLDQDCNGHDTIACTVDADHDGFGTTALTTVFAGDGSCDTSQGESGSHDDCLDNNPNAHPGVTEVPGDGVDNDCVAGDAQPCWTDGDHDGFGDPAAPILVISCDADGQADNDDDCLPGNPLAHPDGIEVPGDGIDQDCSGEDAPLCWLDDDEDTYGDPAELLVVAACTGAKQSTNDDDCDDGDVAIHPEASERCNGLDDNCDAALSDAEDDDDGDDYVECTPSNWGGGNPPSAGLDCNDANPRSYPAAPEFCDGQDNDCDQSLADENGRASFEGAVWTDLTAALAPGTGRGAYAATTNGTLWLCNGTWHASITVPSTIGQFGIRGRNGAASTTLTGTALGADVPLAGLIAHTGAGSGGLFIEDLTLRDGLSTAGGAISYAGTPTATIDDCVIQDNAATTTGGGVHLAGGSLTVTDTTFSGNAATTDGGGLYLADGTVTLINTDFAANDAVNGAGVYAAVAVDSVAITGSSNGPTSGVRADFRSNVATNQGGGLWSQATSLDLETVHFDANEADYGAGIYLTAGTLTDSNVVTLTGNIAAESGGGLYMLAGTVNFDDLYAQNNTAQGGSSQGGAAMAMGDGTLDVDGCDILDNDATGNDAGVLLFDDNTGVPSASFDACTITGNTAVSEGGAFAFFFDGTLNVTGGSTISGNVGADSGGVDFDGTGATFNCTNSAVVDNAATGDKDDNPYRGGAVTMANGTTVVSAGCDWGGGSLDNTVDVNADLTNRDIGGPGAHNSAVGVSSFTCTATASETNCQ